MPCRLRSIAWPGAHATLDGIAVEFASNPSPQPLPWFDDDQPPERFPYGARSEAAVFVGDLLRVEVPDLSDDGAFEIVAIARRPGVLSKVAIRARVGVPTSTILRIAADHLSRVSQKMDGERLDVPTRMIVGIGTDHLSRLSHQLDGERIDVVRWQPSASGYIADALGLGEVPPMLLLPGIRHARVLLGEIDLRGITGWRGLNAILASSLTGWRIRLEPVAASATWRSLRAAFVARRSVLGTVVGRTSRGPRLEIGGLYVTLSGARSEPAPGEELEVRITRMDADEGRIFASLDRGTAPGQLRLRL